MYITSSFGGCSSQFVTRKMKAPACGRFRFCGVVMEQSIELRAHAEARRILRSLLLGIDPDNHSRLSPECVVMQPEVKVALTLGVEALQDTEWLRRSREKRAKVPFRRRPQGRT